MEILERTLSSLLYSRRGLDAKLFTKGPAFNACPTPTIGITSPNCGPSPATFDVDHTADGAALCPSLTWELPSSIPASSVKEYLVVIQDADVPIHTPILHAAFYHIAPTRTSIANEDLEVVDKEGKTKGNILKGGFKFAKNLRNVVYAPPRPLKGHGPHRYFFFVIALSEGLGLEMSTPAKKDELIKACEGKVLGWGEWIGVANRT
jgi:phosphatidylethanolamine-binding protein (PEBP) family uncharacterized protein